MSKHFTSAKDKYKNSLDSAFSLLFVGIVGIILLILINLNIINLNMSSSTKVLTSVFMGILFLFFIGYGIISIFASKKYKEQISSEEENTDSIKSFITKKTYLNDLNSSIYNENEEDLSDEELYILRTEKLSEIVEKEFPDFDKTLIDELIDALYEDIF